MLKGLQLELHSRCDGTTVWVWQSPLGSRALCIQHEVRLAVQPLQVSRHRRQIRVGLHNLSNIKTAAQLLPAGNSLQEDIMQSLE